MDSRGENKNEDTAAPGVQKAKSPGKLVGFAWKACQDRDELSRIFVLEKALESGLRYAVNLADVIQKTLIAAEADAGYSSTEAEVLGAKYLKKWTAQVADLEKQSRGLEVLVGVAGATGAGKTSFLNALLGFKDLLPPDNSFAATATICKVMYNYDPEPSQAFRAAIRFRSRNDVKQELEELYANLRKRQELENKRNKTSPDESQEQDEDEDDVSLDMSIREVNSMIKETADKVKAVWGYTLEELETKTADDILSKQDSQSRYIGTTKHISHSDQREFSEKLTPFLKTTVTQSSSGVTKQNLALWPIIQDVQVFAKSDILKSGVVLVDLPGLSDVIASRAKVASDYYDKLAITVIVAPIVRAAHEQVAVNLMDKNQEMNLRMNDKMNSRNFCVVLSKTDDIDWQSQAAQLGRNDVLQKLTASATEVRNLKAKMKRAKKDIEKLKRLAKTKKGTGGGATAKETSAVSSSERQLREELTRYRRRFKVKRREHGRLKSEVAYNEIEYRNKGSAELIQRHFEERRQILSKSYASDATLQQPIPVFPISTKAFWSVKNGEKTDDPCLGFPQARYTGIPEVSDWLRCAAIPQREQHVTAILNRLNTMLDSMETWSNDECKNNRVHYSKAQLEQQITGPTCEKLKKALDECRIEIGKDMLRCNPLHKKKESVILQCADQVRRLVDRFIYVYPEDVNSAEVLHPRTHRANIDHNGGRFISHSKGRKITFNWMETLALSFKENIVGEWFTQLHQNIPGLERPASRKIDQIWDSKISSLQTAVIKQFPQHREYLERETAKLFSIKESVKDQIKAKIKAVSDASASVHGELAEHLQRKWKTAFARAKVAKGRPIMTARQAVLKKYAREKGHLMFKDSVDTMAVNLKRVMDKVPVNLGKAWQRNLGELRTQLSLIVDNIIKADGSGDGKTHEQAEAKKSQLQAAIRSALFQWIADWTEAIADADLSILSLNKRPLKYEELAPGAVDDEEEGGLDKKGRADVGSDSDSTDTDLDDL